ncbi:putative G-protein coupled receptor 150 [Gastrophryne carolinensis]
MDELLLLVNFSLADNTSISHHKMPPVQEVTSISTSIPVEVVGPPPYNRQLRIITMSVIFTVALVGNCVVLYNILTGKDKRKKINFLITHLALADLYVSIMALLPQIIWELLEDEWLAGDVACRIFKVFQVSGLIASSNIIAIVALERHHVIKNPLSAPLPTRSFTTCGWLLALFLSLPQAFVFKAAKTEEGSRCRNVFGQLPRWHFQAYIIYSSVTVFFLPFCILVVTYSHILWIVWRNGKSSKTAKHFVDTCQPQAAKTPLKLVAANSYIPRAKVKTLKMTLAIIILFIVCGLPYFIVEMKVAFGTITGLDKEVMAVLGIFVVTNSAVNPYVYLFFRSNNRFFRRLEQKVCFSCCLQEQREINFPSYAPSPRRQPSITTTTSELDTSSAACLQPKTAIKKVETTI